MLSAASCVGLAERPANVLIVIRSIFGERF